MGGFSASYLVRASSAESVAEELQRLLAAEGWKPSNVPLDDEDMWGVGGSRRGIIVCEPTGGWVAVIDSAAMVSETPASLSQALATSAFNFHVHDSDFWTYSFFRLGEAIDRFTSMDESEYFGDAIGEIDDMPDDANNNTMSSLQQRWDCLYDCLCEGATRAAFDDALTPVDLSTLQNFPLTSGEEGLAAFLKLLGADPSLADLSYRYWLEDANAQSLVQHGHLLYEHSDVAGNGSNTNGDDPPTIDVSVSALHSAAASNDIETIEELVADGTDINAIPRGFTVTALAMAASYGTPETIRKLVSLGADLQKKGKEGASPLRFAVQSGNAVSVSVLIELGADPHEFDSLIGSLLHQAVLIQSPEVLSRLIEHGVNRSLKNSEGFTPLEFVKVRRAAIEQMLAGMGSQDVSLLKECLDAFLEMEQVLETD